MQNLKNRTARRAAAILAVALTVTAAVAGSAGAVAVPAVGGQASVTLPPLNAGATSLTLTVGTRTVETPAVNLRTGGKLTIHYGVSETQVKPTALACPAGETGAGIRLTGIAPGTQVRLSYTSAEGRVSYSDPMTTSAKSTTATSMQCID